MPGPSPNKRGASSSMRPPPATAPRPQITASRMFTGAETSPRVGARTPRASLAAVSAPRSVPYNNNTPGRPSTLATPAAQLARSSRRAPSTPATTSALTRNAQLVRTPATIRAQSRLARGAGGGASGWRASLTHGGADEARQRLEARRRLVQESAVDALERLLMVGRDGVGEDNGVWTVGEEDERLFDAFEALKKAHLSSSVFLDTSALAGAFPNEVVDNSSPLNSLARLSNFTTFLHLVLSSRPDPETGVAQHAGLANLKQATEAFLKHVKPLEEPVDDKALELLTDLKTQTFIAAASLSPEPLDPASFFSGSLASHLPPSSSVAMTDRAATTKFRTSQSARINLIVQTGGDWAVLRTKYRWEETARRARDWVEEMLGKSGLSGATERSLGSEGTLSDDGFEGEAGEDANGRLAADAADAGTALEFERMDRTESEDPEQAYNTASEDEQDGDEVQLPGALASIDAEQQTAEGLEVDDEDFVDLQFVEGSSQDESARVAQQLGVGALQHAVQSVAAAISPQLGDRADSLLNLMTARGAQSADLQTSDAAMVEAETVTTLVTEVSDRADELAAMFETQNDNQEQSESLIDELLDLDEEVGPAATTSRPATPASSKPAHQQQASPTPRPVQDGLPPSQRVSEASHLRFGPGNVLMRVKEPRSQRSLLDRQPDAEKIAFDSQSQTASPASPPPTITKKQSGKSEGKAKRVSTSPPLSPEGARAARRIDESLERQFRQSPALEENGGSDAPRQAAAGPSTFFPENDTYENEFGGGSDEFGAGDAGPDEAGGAFELAGANNLRDRRERDEYITIGDTTDKRRDRDREPLAQNNRSQAKGKQRATSLELEGPPPEVRAAAYNAVRQAFKASGPVARARRDSDGRSDSESSDEDASQRGSGFGKSGKRRRAGEEDVFSDDESPPPRKQKSSGRRRAPSAPQPTAALKRSGNAYALDRNAPGGRIPWTTTEERLLEELLQAHGTNWKKMIAKHGPEGFSSRTFRHRNVVALKDKAVNMKVKILRAGGKPPKWMDAVTVPRGKLPKELPQGPRPNETDDESSD